MQILIYLIVFLLQIIAPLATFILIIITLFAYNEIAQILLIVFSMLYFIGYITSNLSYRSQISPLYKSELERNHPLFYQLLSMLSYFLPAIIVTTIFSIIDNDFSMFLQYTILLTWILKFSKYFINIFISRS